MNLAQAKTVYRAAIDSKARDSEGHEWWSLVAEEMRAVAVAHDSATAAEAISWWHADWRSIGDTPTRAAQRIRRAAARVGN